MLLDGTRDGELVALLVLGGEHRRERNSCFAGREGWFPVLDFRETAAIGWAGRSLRAGQRVLLF